MKKKKRISFVLIGTMIVSILSGCGEITDIKTDVPTKEEEKTSEAENSIYPMTFQNYDRKVTVTQKPQMICPG